jgi:hypothetical protein
MILRKSKARKKSESNLVEVCVNLNDYSFRIRRVGFWLLPLLITLLLLAIIGTLIAVPLVLNTYATSYYS